MGVIPYNPDMDRLRNAFGSAIFQVRRRAGLSQAELAKAAGVSQSALDQWEQSGALPSLSSLWLVAKALGCTPSLILSQVEREMER